MDDLQDISAFVAVVRGGGFGAAARASGVPKSSLSRRVAALEAHLGTTLLRRTTRQVVLTEAGITYYDTCSQIMASLESARAELQAKDQEVQGLIRISAPAGLGNRLLAPLVATFAGLYPKVYFDLSWSNEFVDLIAGRFDLALRSGHLTDSSLRSRKIGTGNFLLYASPQVADRYNPQKPEDLTHAPVVAFTPWGHHWELRQSAGKRFKLQFQPVLQCSDMDTVQLMCALHSGIALLPEFEAQENVRLGKLVHILPEWGVRGKPFWLVYPSQQYMPRRVRLFIDFLSKNLHTGNS